MAVIISGVLLAAGCSGGAAVERDASVRVRLDPDRVQVIMPITEYRMTPEMLQKLRVVDALLVRGCMKARGFRTVVPSLKALQEMRVWGVWGVWSVERAERYGLGMPGYVADPDTPEYEAAAEACWEPAQKQHQEWEGQTGFVDELKSKALEVTMRAHEAAKQTEEFRVARREYDDCLRKAGFQPSGDVENWGATKDGLAYGPEGSPTAEEIRVVVAEARCNVGLDITQRMGDLEASFQAPLIKANQAVLNTEREGIVRYDKLLDEYIRTHQ